MLKWSCGCKWYENEDRTWLKDTLVGVFIFASAYVMRFESNLILMKTDLLKRKQICLSKCKFVWICSDLFWFLQIRLNVSAQIYSSGRMQICLNENRFDRTDATLLKCVQLCWRCCNLVRMDFLWYVGCGGDILFWQSRSWNSKVLFWWSCDVWAGDFGLLHFLHTNHIWYFFWKMPKISRKLEKIKPCMLILVWKKCEISTRSVREIFGLFGNLHTKILAGRVYMEGYFG